MSDPQIFPHLFNENEEFKSIVSKCKIDQTSKQVYPEQVVKDVHSIGNFLSDRPMPYYQGPFLSPIKSKMLGKSFKEFTTFKHHGNVDCATWTMDANNEDKHTTTQTKSSEILNLAGPASLSDSTLIYSCEIGGCRVGCLCSICNKPSICTGRSCAETPCENCNVQCCEHKIGLSRTFAEDEDLFTLIVQKGEATNESNLINIQKFKLKKYASIPNKCQVCSKDLKDHQLYHKVFHSRCKFCKEDFRFIEDCVSLNDMKRTRKEMETQEDQTCSSCYKLFATKFARKRHEYGAHGEASVQCLVCSRMFQSETSLQKHSEVYHSHSTSTFPCSHCTKILSTEQILKRHIETVHGEKSFECYKCGKKFSRNNHCIRHLRDVHSIETKLNLNYTRTELLYKFKCIDCEAKFKRLETLKRHEIFMHGEPSVFKCKVCSKTFNRDFNRNRHESGCTGSM